MDLKEGYRFRARVDPKLIIRIIGLSDSHILWENEENLRRWLEKREDSEPALAELWELIADEPKFDGKGAVCPYCNTRDSNIYNSGFTVECVNPKCFCYHARS